MCHSTTEATSGDRQSGICGRIPAADCTTKLSSVAKGKEAAGWDIPEEPDETDAVLSVNKGR